MSASTPEPFSAAETGVSEELKHEAIIQLASAAMEFFRVESPEMYEEVATAYVEEVIADLCKRFNDEDDSLKDDYDSVEDAFNAVISMYVDMALVFDKQCPLEHQMGMMLRKVKAATSLINVNDDVSNSTEDLKAMELSDELVDMLDSLQI